VKILNLSHFDTDGIVSTINIAATIDPSKHTFKFQNVGYGKIDKYLDLFSQQNFDVLFVTDLNLAKEQLEFLGKMKKPSNKIFYIDHHSYEFDVKAFLNERGITCIHDQQYSGCMNTYNFLTKNGKDLTHLQELNTIVDTYDLWKKNDPKFITESIPLNDLFWTYGLNKFYSKFRYGYALTDEDKEVIRKVSKERTEYLTDAIQNYSQHFEQSNSILIYKPSQQFTNDFTIFYPQYDIYFIIRESKDGKSFVSLRINDQCDLTIQPFYSILKERYKGSLLAGGHTKSGGMTVDTENLENFIEVLLEIAEELNTHD